MIKPYELDEAFFALSHGDISVYQKLCDWYLDEGTGIAIAYAKSRNIKGFRPEDCRLILHEMFLVCLRQYCPSQIPFRNFAIQMIRKRISRIVFECSNEGRKTCLSLDSGDEEGNNLIDVIESDDYRLLMEDVNSPKKYQMASKNGKNTKQYQRIKKILELKENGFNKNEILKLLKLSDGAYRYAMIVYNEILRGKRKVTIK